MLLSVRPKVYSLPSYSLTGDLIAFRRCGLQYRYTHIGKLPPSRPVQRWFGEFIHGVLEEAFRRYHEGGLGLPPWSSATIEEIRQLIRNRLLARGLRPWDPDLEVLGDRRAEVAINDLGPALFPLIRQVEVRLYGARTLPDIDPALRFRDADRYEITGVVDVLTSVELTGPGMDSNPVVRLLQETLPAPAPARFEIIVDYKGMRRPASQGAAQAGPGQQYEWQIQTYAELRRKQAGAQPVHAGILIYLNELHPSANDMRELKKEIQQGLTDIVPERGSEDEERIRSWSSEQHGAALSLAFRLKRALRIVPVSPASIATALTKFDETVKAIETCRGREAHGATLLEAWDRNPQDEDSCVLCDARTFCPDFQRHYAKRHNQVEPPVPGVSVRE